MPVTVFDLDLARLAATFCVCLALSVCASDIVAGAMGQARRSRAAGGLIGLAIWADPLLAGWPAPPALWALGLPIVVGISIWALSAFFRAEGLLGVIGGGAILGGGMAFSHGAALALVAAPSDATFDDAPFTAGIGLSTALAVLALLLWRSAPRGPAKFVAGVAIAAAATVSRASARIASGIDVPAAGGACPWASLAAATLVLAALWAIYRLELRGPPPRQGVYA